MLNINATPRLLTRASLLCVLFWMVGMSQSHAIQYLWTGAVDSSWGKTGNWTRLIGGGGEIPTGVLPQAADTVVIRNAGGPFCYIDGVLNPTVRMVFILDYNLFINPGRRLTTDDVYIAGDPNARLFAATNVQIFVNRNWSNLNYLDGFNASPSSRVLFQGAQGSIVSGWTRFWDVTVTKSPGVYVRTRLHNETGFIHDAIVPVRRVLESNWDVNDPTNFTKIFIQNDLTIDQGVLKVDQTHPDTLIDMQISGNITINNNGGFNLEAGIPNAAPFNAGVLALKGVAAPQTYTASLLRVGIGRNYRDNNAPFPPSATTGLWFAPAGNAAGANPTNQPTYFNSSSLGTTPRPIIVFNGRTGNQTILGQYPMPDWNNTLNQGNGLFLPAVLVDKPDQLAVQMLCTIKICGDAWIINGSLATNGRNVLFGERNDRVMTIRENGVFNLQAGSQLRIYSSNGTGCFVRVLNGGRIRLVGTQSDRTQITRDANVGQYWQLAVYTGGEIEARYCDFNFQNVSNANYTTRSADLTPIRPGLAAIPASVATCAAGAGNPCSNSNGGLKIFAGAVLDPDNLGNNLSDCGFSAGATNYTAVLLNVNTTPAGININGMVFNGDNGAASGTPATAATRNIVSNSTGTAIFNINGSSGLIGGEVLGEIWDDGTNEANVNWFGANRAEWIGGVSTAWSNPSNWALSPAAPGVVPGTPGNENYYVIMTRETAQRNLQVDGNYAINGSMFVNYAATTTPVQVPRSVNFNAGVTLTIGQDFFNFGRGNCGGTAQCNAGTVGVVTVNNNAIRVGGNFMTHYFNDTWNPGTGTVTFFGGNIQQFRMGTGTGNFNKMNNFIIDKTGVAFQQNNGLVVLGNFTFIEGEYEIFTDQPFECRGNFEMQAGTEWKVNNSEITVRQNVVFQPGSLLLCGSSGFRFTPNAATTYTFQTNDQRFFDFTFGATGAGTTYNTIGDVHSLGTTTVNANARLVSQIHPTRLNAAAKYRFQNITLNGRVTLKAYDELLINPNSTLTVSNTGRIDLVGTPAGTIKISRDGITGTYGFTVNGAIQARYALFEFMNVTGINCASATSIPLAVAPDTASFSDCIFTNGAGVNSLANATYLALPNANVWGGTGNVKIYNASFPVFMTPNTGGTPACNVRRATGGSTRVIDFMRPSGAFAGEDYDVDPDNRVTWEVTGLKRWDGGASTTNWFDANNWFPNGVPLATEDVLLDHFYVPGVYTVNIPAGSPVTTRDLLISSNFPSANVINLNVNSNLTVNGFFTCQSLGFVNIPNSSVVTTFRKNFSSTGRWTNGSSGVSTNRVVFSGVGINVISMSLSNSIAPFYDVDIAQGQWELNTPLSIARDFTIASGATFDVGIGNYNLEVGRHFTCNGAFQPRFGRVTFLDFSIPALSNYSAAFSQNLVNNTGSFLNFFDLRINKYLNTTRHVTLTGRILIGGVLDLQQRNLIVDCSGCKTDALYDNLPVIDIFGSWASAGPGSFVDGRLGRTFVSAVTSTQSYPIGKGTVTGDEFPELNIALTAEAPTVFTMEVFNTPASEVGRPLPADTVVGPPLRIRKLASRHYNVKKFGGGQPLVEGGGSSWLEGTVKLNWKSDTTISRPAGFPDGMTSLANNWFVIQDNGADVDGLGPIGNGWNTVNGLVSGDFQSGSILSSGLFPLTTLGNGDIAVAFYDIVLPVQVLDFRARRNTDNQVNLSWTSFGEQNLAGYRLLRSAGNTEDFQPIASYLDRNELIARGGEKVQTRYDYVDAENLKPGSQYFYRLQAISASGQVLTEETRSVNLPTSIQVDPIYPNPFNQNASLDFYMDTDNTVSVEVFDLNGRKVYTALNEFTRSGNHTVDLNATQLPSGIYLVKFRAGDYQQTFKVIKAASY